jgi:hypothetical protein
MVIVIAVVLTALTGNLVYDYANSFYEGPDAAIRVFLFGFTGAFALLSWSVGLLLVLGDRAKDRRWKRVFLTVALLVAAAVTAVLLTLAKG